MERTEGAGTFTRSEASGEGGGGIGTVEEKREQEARKLAVEREA